jgi:protein TonB
MRPVDWARIGAAIGRAHEEPIGSLAGRGGNVIPLKQLRAFDTSAPAPDIGMAAAERPAPPVPQTRGGRRLALLALASLAAHVGLYAAANLHRVPEAGIAEEAITVEIVVGANSAAGTADMRSDSEVESQASTAAPQVAAVQAPDEPRIEEKPAAEMAPPREPEPVTPAPQAMEAPAEEPIPFIQKDVTPPERKAEEPPPDPKPEDRPQTTTKSAAASAPAASSVGRGRMAGDANYKGLVAARLARFKQFPSEARRRREQGAAVVSFEIDGSGRATAIRLVRRTGFAALDREVQAMVERASPFPPPPGGVTMSFTAPVNFTLN